MIKTYGLTHIALSVEDPERSCRFYKAVFGVEEMYNKENFIQVQTPGCRDIIVFEQKQQTATSTGGIQHFGFRLQDAADIDKVVEAVEKAGGTIRERGAFCPGEPYVFFYDPDGYEVEVWYELLPEGKSFR